MNICSVVIHARPENLGSVKSSLGNMAGVELHGGSDAGKLIVTVEDTEHKTVAETIHEFYDINGVINAVMIYHYDGDEDMDEEVAL